jgi:hypothetical protein
MLIYVVSFALQSPISLNIHNRYQHVNLISPIYFVHGGKWHATPDRKIDANDIMKNRLEFGSGQDMLEGVLVYRIQRQHAESDKSAHNESKSIQLLLAWRTERTEGPNVRALLVEHDKELDEDKLRWLHQKYWHLLKEWVDPTESNWMLNDVTTLTTTVNVMNGGYRWDVFISEGIKNNVERPLWIDVER